MAAALTVRGHGAALVLPAQEPQAEPAWGAEGAKGDWARDQDAIPDHLVGEALPLVMEVYGWLGWASSGSTRGMRNPLSHAVFLRRDGWNQEVPLGGWVAQKDHERVLRAVVRAGWPDREPTWPAFLEGGGGAPRHERRGQQLAPPGPAHRPHPLALPPGVGAAAVAPAPTHAAAQVMTAPGSNDPARRAQGGGKEPATRGSSGRPGPLDPERPPPPASRSLNRGPRAAPSRGGKGNH